MIQKINRSEGYSEMSVESLILKLFNDHHVLSKVIASFYKQYEKLQSSDKTIDANLTGIISAFIELDFFLKQHVKKEEQLLQNYLQHIDTHKINAESLKEIKREHEAIKYQLTNIRYLSNNYTTAEEALPGLKLFYAQLFSIEQDLLKHILLQEDFLFPKLTLNKK